MQTMMESASSSTVAAACFVKDEKTVLDRSTGTVSTATSDDDAEGEITSEESNEERDQGHQLNTSHHGNNKNDESHHHPNQKVKETNFHSSQMRNSIAIGTLRNHVNDDEKHEENPHLQDFLIPDHSVHHIERAEELACKSKQNAVTDGKSCHRGIIHDQPISDETQAKRNRKVKFDSVLVRDYAIMIGDHPCCSIGPPLAIDWEYLQYEPISLDEYEFHHAPRRSMREMLQNYYRRKHILTDAGYTEKDFKEAQKSVTVTKLNRYITKQRAPYLPFETAMESGFRKFKRLLKEDHWKRDKALFAR